MVRIKKVLNSSVVLITDEQGAEYIISGKGIGYGKKQNEEIDLNDATYQTFIPVTSDKSKQIAELVNSISPEILELTHKVILLAKKELQADLNDNLYFILADHLNFAVERFQKNMVITNRLQWEIKSFYEKEYVVGQHCLELVNRELDLNLPEDEAVNIAFHLVNAQSTSNPNYDSARYAKLIGEIVHLVCYSLNKTVDKDSIHYTRFITHICFFVERFFTDKMLEDEDNTLYLSIRNQCKKEEKIAKKVKEFIMNKYKKEIPDEELSFLIVHINRLNRN